MRMALEGDNPWPSPFAPLPVPVGRGAFSLRWRPLLTGRDKHRPHELERCPHRGEPGLQRPSRSLTHRSERSRYQNGFVGSGKMFLFGRPGQKPPIGRIQRWLGLTTDELEGARIEPAFGRSGWAVLMKPREHPSCAHSLFGALVARALSPSANKASRGPSVSRRVLDLAALA
jgi:hypothetical protein